MKLEACCEKALEDACKDVCPYCDGRCPGYGPAIGPNKAGNWVHKRRIGSAEEIVLCKASPIRARLRASSAN